MSAPVLAVDGLRVDRVRPGGLDTIVSCVSLSLRAGETIAIVGESGSGKSMTAKAITGLLPRGLRSSGEVRYGGRNLLGLRERQWRAVRGREIGLILQDPFTMLNPVARCAAILAESLPGGPRLGRAERRAEVARRLAEVGIDDETVAERYPFQLSGGMRQRVAIARTLILHPRIILMDEPFGALDPMTRMTMQDLLLELWRSTQATVFFVTHSIEEAVFLGDRIYVLSNSPGTILHELTIEPSDRPSKEMQREEKFQQTVYYLRDLISQLEESRRAGT
jgi:peptide/nickel transport system ATP-binding protein